MTKKDNTHKFTTCDFSVRLGVHNLSNANEEGRISASVNAIYIHPDWDVNMNSNDADIAVLELANDVVFNKFVRPICVPDVDSDVARVSNGTVIGFGKTETGFLSDVTKKLEIPFYDFKNCTTHSSDHTTFVSARTFCGGTSDRRGVCDGNSGGGVYVKHGGRFYLRGLVSFGLLNADLECDVETDAVFTDVPKFYGWIKSGGLDQHAANRVNKSRK